MTCLRLVVCRSSLACAMGILAGCGGQAPDRQPLDVATPASQSTRPLADGEAAVSGRAPAARSGVPSVVILEPVQPRDFGPQSTLPVMDQVSLAFTPSILFTRVGQPSEFRNSDPELHNIRVMDEATKEPAFNVALPTGGTFAHTFLAEGFYDVGCDIHPGMSAVVVATRTPFVALAGPDGAFRLSNVPAGDYTLTVYSGASQAERKVTVTAGPVDVGDVSGP